MLRILTLSSLYPNAVQPDHGVFVEQRLRQLVATGEVAVQVVAPVPWFPYQSGLFGRYAAFARVPRAEIRAGIAIDHPRYPLIPKVGMAIAPHLMALALRRMMLRRSATFDLIDAHYLFPDGVAAVLLGRWIHKPVVLTARGSDVNVLTRYATPRRMILSAARSAARIVTVSGALRARLLELGVAESKITVLPNGVDLELFKPAHADSRGSDSGLRHLLVVGHLKEGKGHGPAIEALRTLTECDLTIVGDGPLQGPLRRQAQTAGVGDRVRFVGRVEHSELAERYRNATALVLASEREGLPNVILEALACGTPVVATAVGGVPEILTEPVAGVLMKESSASALVAAVRSSSVPIRIGALYASSRRGSAGRRRLEGNWIYFETFWRRWVDCVKKKLLFVATRFPFPVDSGGKIRTTQILRGLKGGLYEIVLACPATALERQTHAAAIGTICDHLASWDDAQTSAGIMAKIFASLSLLPIPVATDRSARGSAVVRDELAARPDVVVFDFPHSAVLAPRELEIPSVLFTHNVEAEIFERHAAVSSWPSRLLWRSQFQKMLRFERQVVNRFSTVIAVSQRDADKFARQYGAAAIAVINTGVDLDYFSYAGPGAAQSIVFTGSMDWLANRDGIDYFMEDIWPLIAKRAPEAVMTVVGRSPPGRLISKARAAQLSWRFTGYVEDVREHVRVAGVYVIPLRVAGGTRLKVYEAMAMGCPVVSTSIGVEGLPLLAGEHYLRADDSKEFAEAVLRLLNDAGLRARVALSAHRFVQENCSFQAVARQFERICDDTVRKVTATAIE